jgi:transposase-like protein
LIAAGEHCEALLSAKICGVPVDDVRCDEIWTYVGKEESRLVYEDKNYHWIGDAWTFIAIERNTKPVLTLALSRRNTMSATRFMAKVARATGSAGVSS